MTLTRPTLAGRRLLLVTAGVAAAVSFALPATAKEAGSGGTTTTSTCSPVSSLRAQGDPHVGESGLAAIDVDYSVKPCDNKQAVTVETKVAEYFDPSAVVWDDTAAALSDKFTVYGVKLRTTYVVTVIVRDAATGAMLGSATQSAAAVPLYA